MKKREKIILVIMALVVLYGAYELFFASAGKKEIPGKKEFVKTTNTVDELIKKVNNALNEVTVTDVERYIIASAEAKWANDPFLFIKPKRGGGVPGTGPEDQVNIRYTGYIEMGDLRLAILNGMEYESGEEILPGGYILRVVKPDRVVVQNKADKREVTVMITEEKL
jgi:hypothetical protein